MDPRDAFKYLINQIREQAKDNLPRYLIPEQLAKPLLSYQSIRHDLIFIKEATEKLKESDLDQTTMASLWHTVIVLYGKCFVSSEHSTKLEVDSCFSEQHQQFLETHKALMNLRHNFVAHRGKTIHEFSLAFIKVDSVQNQLEIKIEHLKRNRPEHQDLQKYTLLFDYLINITEEKIKKAGNKIMKRLHATTTPDDLFKI
jgi:hypothetical protein